MKVCELFERAVEDAEKLIAELKSKLTDINDEIAKLKSKGTGVGQGAVAPQYQNQYNKLMSAKRSIQEKIKIEQQRSGSTEKSHEWHQSHIQKHANPEESKKRKHEAMSSGMKISAELRKKYGDWAGVARHVGSMIKDATDNGKEKLQTDQMEQIANKLGITPRTLYKWMERSEFKTVRRYMPSEW